MSVSENPIPVEEIIERYNRELMDAYRRSVLSPASPPEPISVPVQGTSTQPVPAREEPGWLDARYPVPDPVRDRERLESETPAPSVPPVPAVPPAPSVPYTPIVPPVPSVSPVPGGTGSVAEPFNDGDYIAPYNAYDIEPPAVSDSDFSVREEAGEIALPDIPVFPYQTEDLEGRPPYPEEPLIPPETVSPPYVGYLQVFAYTARGAEPLEGARITVTRSGTDGSVLMASAVTDRDGLSPEISLPSVNPALTMQPQTGQPYVLYDIRVSLDGFSTVIYENVPVYGNNYVTQPAALIPLLPGENDTVPRVYRSGGPADL